MSILKEEWRGKKDTLKRKCLVCSSIFKPSRWNQVLCTNAFCKKGYFLFAHYKASLKRWNEWKKEALKSGYKLPDSGGE